MQILFAIWHLLFVLVCGVYCYCLFEFGAFWNHHVLAEWIMNLFLLYLDFTIKSTNVLRVSVEQHKKGRSRFSSLGIKRWVKQIKHNAFIWNLNNCYYPHCVRAVIFGSQRKKERKKQQPTEQLMVKKIIYSLKLDHIQALPRTWNFGNWTIPQKDTIILLVWKRWYW